MPRTRLGRGTAMRGLALSDVLYTKAVRWPDRPSRDLQHNILVLWTEIRRLTSQGRRVRSVYPRFWLDFFQSSLIRCPAKRGKWVMLCCPSKKLCDVARIHVILIESL